MKKEDAFYLALLIVISSAAFAAAANSESVKADSSLNTITGRVTSDALNFSISVNAAPSLNIKKPLNKTYFENESLAVQIITNGESVWYNLDNGSNITLADAETGSSREISRYFNTTEGSHIIFVFANNSLSTTSSNVTFNVDDSSYEINYSEFSGADKGSSTNFNEFSVDELQNVGAVVLENASLGKISFIEPINITDDGNPNDNMTNIDDYITISQNNIFINSTVLQNFNKSASLTLYNLGFTNPRILMDGAVCPSSVCYGASYSGGNLTFNVTHFTVYSAEETPTPSAESGSSGSSSGGGGGGSGGSSAQKISLKLNPIVIAVSMLHGKFRSFEITLENIGKNTAAANIRIEGLESIAMLSNSDIILKPGEKKPVRLDIFAPRGSPAGVYLGRVVFETAGIIQNTNVIVEITDREPIFDIKVSIPSGLKEFAAGDTIPTRTEIKNIGLNGESLDVSLRLLITDYSRNIYSSSMETLAVSGNLSLERSIALPSSAIAGDYILIGRLTYRNVSVASYDTFSVFEAEISAKELPMQPYYAYDMKPIVISVLILAFAAVLLLFYNWVKGGSNLSSEIARTRAFWQEKIRKLKLKRKRRVKLNL